MSKYTIIGLGWLGTPLAMHFLGAGHSVAGTTRNSEKAHELTHKGIQTVLFDVYETDFTTLPCEIFQDANVIINIPPGRKDFAPPLFIARMKSLFDYALTHKSKHICFISTTSVFGGLEGRISNDSALTPNTPSGNAHVELELYLKDLAQAYAIETDSNEMRALLNKESQYFGLADISNFSCSVLRLAGLVGKDRHPITTLSQKSNVAQGRDPVNLIHQQDVIQIIEALLQNSETKNRNKHSLETTGKLVENNFYAANLCSSAHPTREDYYTWCAAQKGIRCPEFMLDTRDFVSGKWIDAQQTTAQLKVQLYYPSPYNMLQ